jgi:hypothetical protein
VPVDCVTTHHCPTDAFGREDDDPETQLANRQRGSFASGRRPRGASWQAPCVLHRHETVNAWVTRDNALAKVLLVNHALPHHSAVEIFLRAQRLP